ncbi:dockerin type I domain-containing protein [Acetivibrio saccincola]
MVDNVKITGLPSTQPTPTQSPKPTPPGSYGDINGDGIINSSDYALLTRHILEIPVQNANLNNADLNGDGVVDSLDATILSRYLLEVIDRFPVQR